jgi:hypothetical protein
VLENNPIFVASTAKHYLFIQEIVNDLPHYLARGKAGFHELLADFLTGRGTLEQPDWAWEEVLAFVRVATQTPVRNPLLTTYWSMGAVRHGYYIAKIRVAPAAESATQLIHADLDLTGGPEVFYPTLVDELQVHAFNFDLQAQLCTNLTAMPVNELTVEWPRKAVPLYDRGTRASPVPGHLTARQSREERRPRVQPMAGHVRSPTVGRNHERATDLHRVGQSPPDAQPPAANRADECRFGVAVIGKAGGTARAVDIPVHGTPRESRGHYSGARIEPDREDRTAMTTQSETATAPEPDQTVEQKIKKLWELYADAPEVGKQALQNALREGGASWVAKPRTRMESAGRVGNRQGRVSELTVIVPFAEGGAERLRGLLAVRDGNFDDTDRVGTVHDMRFVFLDNDTKLLFATAYDDAWDPYIDDFATKIPNEMDLFFCNCVGWPGIHSPSVKDWIVKYQVAADGWYVAHPDLTVVEARRLKRVGHALEEFLDKISD